MTQQQDQRPYPGHQVNQFGTPVGPTAPSVTPYALHQAPETDTLAIVALVFAVVLWPVGLVLGPMALRRTRQPGVAGRGLALAATWVSFVYLALTLLGVLLAIAIPVYLNQQNRATDADLERDLGTAATVMHGERALAGAFPAALPQPAATSGATEQVRLVSASADTFCLVASGDTRVLYMDEQSATSSWGCP